LNFGMLLDNKFFVFSHGAFEIDPEQTITNEGVLQSITSQAYIGPSTSTPYTDQHQDRTSSHGAWYNGTTPKPYSHVLPRSQYTASLHSQVTTYPDHTTVYTDHTRPYSDHTRHIHRSFSDTMSGTYRLSTACRAHHVHTT